jgi:hypothetical protein
VRFGLHAAQQEIHNHPARFKVVVCGRRFGKTTYAIIKCIVEGLRETNDYGDPLTDDSEVVYIGTTLEQARRNAWHILKKLSEPVIGHDANGRALVYENQSMVVLLNGVRIRLLGMDNPDAARGMKLRFATLDEYAQMPEMAWPEIIRPALMDTRGQALFIGTPKGMNHFYRLFHEVDKGQRGPDWAAFNFSSFQNTFMSEDEVRSAAIELTRGTPHLMEQEINAKFVNPGGEVFSPDMFPIREHEPDAGTYQIAVDLAGFIDSREGIKQRDETAIAVVKVYPLSRQEAGGLTGAFGAWGWYVKDILHGQWDVRRTAFNIMSMAAKYQVSSVGIEKGALKYAVDGYLSEYTREFNRIIRVEELTHGNKSKYDRIRWALEGRAHKGRISLAPGAWNEAFIQQACGFPSKLVHDDLLDAVAYVDQIATNTVFDLDAFEAVRFEPLDEDAGY